MTIVCFIVLSVLLFALLLSVEKAATWLELLVAACLVCIVNFNMLTLFSLNLNWIVYGQTIPLFWCFLLSRNLCAPCLLALWVNALTRPRSPKSRLLQTAACWVALCGLEAAELACGAIRYAHWSFSLSAVGWGLLMIAVFLIGKSYRRLLWKEVAARA